MIGMMPFAECMCMGVFKRWDLVAAIGRRLLNGEMGKVKGWDGGQALPDKKTGLEALEVQLQISDYASFAKRSQVGAMSENVIFMFSFLVVGLLAHLSGRRGSDPEAL